MTVPGATVALSTALQNDAAAFLQASEQAARLNWEGVTDKELLEQIGVARSAVRCVLAEIAALASTSGRATAKREAAARRAAARAALNTAPALASLGKEGLDYTISNLDDLDPTEWQVPPQCIPIHANVTTYDFGPLAAHTQFDVIMMDPPWQLATANPTRGVALGYSQLANDAISRLPVPRLQSNGFLFLWVINARYKWALDLFDKWGYKLVDEIVWVKMTVNRRLAKSHGYYLQHAKEVCLVGQLGQAPPGTVVNSLSSDIIYSERRGQSQKPDEIYHIIERLVPNGKYLEIFARKNNLRNYWVSIGNEVTGTGMPPEDVEAMRRNQRIPGAVYGNRRNK